MAWLVSFIRVPLLFIVAAVFYFFFERIGINSTHLFLPDLATVYFTIVNLISFFLMYRILKTEGLKINDLLGFRLERLGKDILFGFLWLIILYFPFVLTVTGIMFFMFGPEFFLHFEEVFVGDAVACFSRPFGLLWFAAVISLFFPFLNAPVEELMYRGYAQQKFIGEFKSMWPGILIPAIGFAFQHAVLAPSFQGAVIYILAFFVWGVGSGLIFFKQKRLFPLIVAHFLVNLAFSVIPMILLISGNK